MGSRPLNHAEMVQLIELYETAADRVACGTATVGAALFSLGALMGIDIELRQVASNNLDASGWDDPVSAGQYVASLLAASVKARSHLAGTEAA